MYTASSSSTAFVDSLAAPLFLESLVNRYVWLVLVTSKTVLLLLLASHVSFRFITLDSGNYPLLPSFFAFTLLRWNIFSDLKFSFKCLIYQFTFSCNVG